MTESDGPNRNPVAAIHATRLTKRYGRRQAVADVSFAVHPQICALLFPNGAGKITTMRVLVGLSARPRYGNFLGRPVHLGAPVLRPVGVLIDGPAFVSAPVRPDPGLAVEGCATS